MDAKEVIQSVRLLLNSTTVSGATVVNVMSVSTVLDAAERQITADIDGELRTHNLKISALRYEHDLERDLEMVKLTTSTGFTALRTAVLINGGAVITLLAFMGSQRGALMPELARNMVGPLAWFTAGTMISAFATGLGYLAQAGFGNEFKWKSVEIGTTARILAFVFVFSAYVTFVVGALNAASAFRAGSAVATHVRACSPISITHCPRTSHIETQGASSNRPAAVQAP